MDNPSICIPRAFKNIPHKVFKETFNTVLEDDKCINRIDLVEKRDKEGKLFHRIFIHLNYWPKNKTANFMKKKLCEGKKIKIVYKEPWFWQCSMSRLPKPGTAVYKFKRPYILMD